MASRDHIFCPVSGSLLSVNKEKKVLNCLSSGYSRTFEDLADVVIRKEIDMDDFARRFDLRPLVPRDALHTGKLALQRDEHTVCPQCSEMGVDFYTKQLRSADEGQTVFYECAKCGHKWNENS